MPLLELNKNISSAEIKKLLKYFIKKEWGRDMYVPFIKGSPVLSKAYNKSPFDINEVNVLGQNLLQQVISLRDIYCKIFSQSEAEEYVAFLVNDLKAEINFCDNKGYTYFYNIFNKKGSIDGVVNLLKNNVNVSLIAEDQLNDLYDLDEDKTHEIINYRDEQNNSLLHYFVKAPNHLVNFEIYSALEGLGIDFNAKNNQGETALYLAAKNGNDKLVEVLLQCGAHKDGKYTGLKTQQNMFQSHNKFVDLIVSANNDREI